MTMMLVCVLLDYQQSQSVCWPLEHETCTEAIDQWLDRAYDWARRSQIQPHVMVSCSRWNAQATSPQAALPVRNGNSQR